MSKKKKVFEMISIFNIQLSRIEETRIVDAPLCVFYILKRDNMFGYYKKLGL